jgi:hypothetical protein
VPAGEPRQLRNVVAQDASFTPDGHLIFSKDTSLFIAEKDGSNPRKLRDLPSHVDNPVVSLDGKRIRLTVAAVFAGGGIGFRGGNGDAASCCAAGSECRHGCRHVRYDNCGGAVAGSGAG